MPFTRVSVKHGTLPEAKKIIARCVHEAMVAAIGIPDDDFFQLISEYGPDDFHFDHHFLGVERSEDLMIVHITMRRGRSDAMKRALFGKIAENLNSKAGVRPQDVFIYLSENDYSDWSVGNGIMSMAITQQRSS